MLSIVFWLVSLAVVEARLDSDHYHTRQQAERDCQVLWFMDPRSVDRIVNSTQSAEVSQRAIRARGRAVSRYLDSLGEPPWCDWPLYSVDRKGWPTSRPPETNGEEWIPIFPEFTGKMYSEIQRTFDDRYRYDYLSYRMLQREWSREYLERGGYRWVVELDWFLGRLVERDFLKHKAEEIERGSP